jgi:hypothetical protein
MARAGRERAGLAVYANSEHWAIPNNAPIARVPGPRAIIIIIFSPTQSVSVHAVRRYRNGIPYRGRQGASVLEKEAHGRGRHLPSRSSSRQGKGVFVLERRR